ncbi:MAG: homoserine dehydrogenase [Chromatiales bacterium]|jgi:hypothetical protein|nr:homoserine dehydrogenase [Chromatiales bacterium]MDX9766348.1 homoserine dehydrogenase [Ectothiorhodospiraceae bacterium]
MSTDKTTVARVALIGLGRVGGRFLEEMLPLKARGIAIVGAAELGDTPGKARAQAAGIPVGTLEEIVDMGDQVDIIFDLSGSQGVRQALRQRLQDSGNRHTTIAPEIMARLLWAVVSDEQLADPHGAHGY